MNNFHKVILPDFISIHLKGGPVFSNNIVRSISGREARIAQRQGSYQKYILENCILSKREFEILSAFFRNRQGNLNSFLVNDFTDNKLEKQILTNYDKDKAAYLIEKTYSDEISSYNRRIFCLNSKKFSSNIEAIKIDFDEGLFYISLQEEKVIIEGEFFVRVRFISSNLQYSYRKDHSILIENLELIEV